MEIDLQERNGEGRISLAIRVKYKNLYIEKWVGVRILRESVVRVLVKV